MNAPSARIERAVWRPPLGDPSSHHWTVSREELGRRGSDLTESEVRYVEQILNDYGGGIRLLDGDRSLYGGMASLLTFGLGGTVLIAQGVPDPVAVSVAGAAGAGVMAAFVIRPGASKARRLRKDLRASVRSRKIEFSKHERDLLARVRKASVSALVTYDDLRRMDADSVGPQLDLFEEERVIARRIYAAARLRAAFAGAEDDAKPLQTLGDVMAAASSRVDALEAYGQRLAQVLDTLREIERLKVASDASGELLDLVTESGMDDFLDSDVRRSTADLAARQEGLQYLVKMLDQDVEHLRDGTEGS